MKDTFVDVKAVLDDSSHVIIEMQVLNTEGLEKRVLYNAAKKYASQLKRLRKLFGGIRVMRRSEYFTLLEKV